MIIEVSIVERRVGSKTYTFLNHNRSIIFKGGDRIRYGR